MTSKIKKFIKKPSQIVYYLGMNGKLRWLPDKFYLKAIYKSAIGKKLNFASPVTFNEKLQYLKIYNRNPLYTTLVDKYNNRKYIAGEVGEEYLVPLIGVWDSFDDIDFEELPDQFVLKCTHDSGGLVICKDKKSLDLEQVKVKINKSLNTNYFDTGREWPYKNVIPKIIAEEYLITNDLELLDFRFFCFGGELKFIAVDFDINDKSKTKRNIYDLNWNLTDYEISYPHDKSINFPKPRNLDKMIEISKKLSKDKPHVRVDMYNIDGRIILSELTFFHQGGFGKIEPDSFSNQMGSWIDLSNLYKSKT